MSFSDDGFVQDYQLGERQHLWLYCRLCRRTFPVVFEPRTADVRLKCPCGYEGPLRELDVFQSEQDAKDHASFYERIYRAAKDALRDAGMPLPPSGKYRRVEDVLEDSEFESYYDESDDRSAIQDGYLERDESDISEVAVKAGLREFDRRLEASDEPLERHEILSELIEWTYVRRQLSPLALERFLSACREDLDLAERVVAQARRLKRTGQKVRLSFTSFKHLLLHHRDEAELEEALDVAEEAAALGLRGYADKAAALREQLGIG